MIPLFIDVETYSAVKLKTGLARYSTAVETIIVTWALEDGEVRLWDVTANPEVPGDLIAAIFLCDRIVAHNAQFDSYVLEHEAWWLKDDAAGKWYCTMAMALRHGLPGGLDKLCTIFKLPEDVAKHKRGRELIHLFCKPQTGGERATRLTHPAEWREFKDYAKSDITSMREIYKKCPKWNDTPFELGLWDLDQRINRRGIAVDVPFATAALRATTAEQKRLAAQTKLAANGGDENGDFELRPTQRDRLLNFLFVEHGVALPDLKNDTIERRLNDPELSEVVKELLRLRQSASKSSTSKYKRLLEQHVAGRLYFLLQYAGAQRTGRWAGRGFQPQNLKRPSIEFEDILFAIDAVLLEAEEVLLDDIMEAMSSALRSVLIASPGHKLVASDLSNIEGRKLAWLAGEEWKLDAFRAYDTFLLDEHGERIPDGKGGFQRAGHDLYILAYANAFNIEPEEVEKWQRQIGKVLELALGYQGGVGAFVSMALALGLDLNELAERVLPTLSKSIRLDAESVWEWAERRNKHMGLNHDVYVACEALKRMWRDAHPNIVAFWEACETAARSAILNPGEEFHAGRLVFDRKGAWLRMRLPSGRYLCYPNPKIENDTIYYAAWNVYKKAWCHEATYGGKFAENASQGSSRDVMAYGMVRAEDAGYPIVLTVHDELVTDPDDSEAFTVDGLSALLAANDDWNEGLPLAAGGFESQRYRK
jgi:DNA polymerase